MTDAVSLEIPGSLAGERIDRAVAMLIDMPRSAAARLVAEGSVVINGRAVTSKSTSVAAGDLVEVSNVPHIERGITPDPLVEFEIRYEDEFVLVVDKPAGLVVHPGAGVSRSTLVHGLLARFPELATVGDPERPGVVHRLDQGTTGLLMVARTDEVLLDLQSQLKVRSLRRRYRCLVNGHPESPTGTIDAPIGRSPRDPTRRAVQASGKPARTHYEVIQKFSSPFPAAELWCDLETGRTHQIRVHFGAIDLPLVGDLRYGAPGTELTNRPMLHAEILEFDHPETGDRVSVESPVPADYETVRGQFS